MPSITFHKITFTAPTQETILQFYEANATSKRVVERKYLYGLLTVRDLSPRTFNFETDKIGTVSRSIKNNTLTVYCYDVHQATEKYLSRLAISSPEITTTLSSIKEGNLNIFYNQDLEKPNLIIMIGNDLVIPITEDNKNKLDYNQLVNWTNKNIPDELWKQINSYIFELSVITPQSDLAKLFTNHSNKDQTSPIMSTHTQIWGVIMPQTNQPHTFAIKYFYRDSFEYKKWINYEPVLFIATSQMELSKAMMDTLEQVMATKEGQKTTRKIANDEGIVDYQLTVDFTYKNIWTPRPLVNQPKWTKDTLDNDLQGLIS